jgi:hypothetical protein
MDSNIQLIYPNINLLQYDLRESLGDSDRDVEDRWDSFYEKFSPFPVDKKKNLGFSRDDRQFFPLCGTGLRRDDIDGSYYPVQMGDCYAIQVNYSGEYLSNSSPSGKEPNFKPQDLATAFKFLKERAQNSKFLPENDRSFGETWLLTAFVTNWQKQDKAATAAIAKSCYQQITNLDNSHQSRGEWLGGEIFEFWQPPSTYDSSLLSILHQSPHVLVWLFPFQATQGTDEYINKTSQKIADTSNYWLRLCHYRHKIFYAYYQSRKIKKELFQGNGQIEAISQAVRGLSQQSSLSQLRKLLLDSSQCLAQYNKLLQYMGDQKATIDINLHNYKSRCLKMAEDESSANSDLNLDFLQNFIDDTNAGRYYRQIAADLTYFEPGLIVLQNLSLTIQSTIQIVQAKNDQTTNLLIAGFAIGIASIQLISSIIIAQNPPVKNIPFYSTPAFQQSLIWAAIGAICILFLIAIGISLFKLYFWLYQTIRRFFSNGKK